MGSAARASGDEDASSNEARLTDIPALTALIEPQASALGFDLVRVGLFGGEDGPVLQVMAERPDTRQLTLADCGQLSRAISDVLDPLEGTADDPMPEAYRLEVSSPGIDRPLTRPKDYDDWAGHKARFRMISKKQIDGDLIALDGDAVRVQMGDEERRVPLAEIGSAKLLLTDKLIAATAPMVTDDAEDFEEEDD